MVTEIWSDFHGRAQANNENAVQDHIEPVKGAGLATMVTSFFQYLEQKYFAGQS
jgi:hypothetical protein